MKILVTAGPTREAIDPIRFISNRSSGKMGYEIARVAAARGHASVLISGPVCLATPPGVERVDVTSAEDMYRAVCGHLVSCDALVMAAAVADWRPTMVSARKIKKDAASPRIELERTRDILSEIRPLKGDRTIVGFAAETHAVEAEALRKLKAKGLDMIVANDVSGDAWGIDSDLNKVILLSADGARSELPVLPKADVALRIIEWVEARRAGVV